MQLREQHEQRPQANRRPGMIPGRRFALALALALGLLGCSGAVTAADEGSAPIVVATVFTSSGPTADSVSLASLQSNPRHCPQYGGQSMEELGRQGSVNVTLPPSGAQTGTWALSTILGCLQAPILSVT